MTHWRLRGRVSNNSRRKHEYDRKCASPDSFHARRVLRIGSGMNRSLPTAGAIRNGISRSAAAL